MKLQDRVKWHIDNIIKHHYPFLWSKHLSLNLLGKQTDFRSPKDLNEKIQWLMFYTDTSLWTLLADKYRVREYVEQKIGKEYLIPLLGKWDRVEDIDFDTLPNAFVIKPNNGSYDTIICRDKDVLDIEVVKRKLTYSLSHKFGYENAEPHYLDIKPCIIAEHLLTSSEKGGLIDYKIWCFDGVPLCIFICANRDHVHHTIDFAYYDTQWNRLNNKITEKYQSDFECPCPPNLNEMLSVAAKLSKGLPQARVDLYNLNGKIFFGEMTMSSNFGMMQYFTQEALNEMGELIILPKRSMNEKISTFIKRWMPRL